MLCTTNGDLKRAYGKGSVDVGDDIKLKQSRHSLSRLGKQLERVR